MNETFQRVAGQTVHYRASDGLLKGLLVGNFKAFGHLQRIPLRPLTLLYGANSTGKSSILHALLLGKHAFENGQLDVLETSPLAGAVDLGGFRQFVHRNDSRREVTLGWQIPSPSSGGEFRAGVPRLTFLDTSLVPALEIECCFGLDEDGGQVRDGIGLRRFAVCAAGEDFLSFKSFGYPVDKTPTQNKTRAFVSTHDRRDTLMVLDGINWAHPALRNWLNTEAAAISGAQLTSADWETLVQNTDDFGSDSWVDAWAGSRREELFPNRVAWEQFLGEDAYNQLRSKQQRLPRVNPARRGALFKMVDILLARLADEILRMTHVQLGSAFERMSYLRAFRRLPGRELGAPEEMDPLWLSSGGGAWAVVSEHESVRAAVNQWLGGESLLSSAYELVVERFAEVEALASGFTKASRRRSGNTADTSRPLQQAARKLAVSQPSSVQNRLRLKDHRTGAMVSLRDVGVGISQVLPVLVGAYGTEGQMHLIEQPEIHLHPRLQAELADVFITSALGGRGNGFVLETHSEHLLLRIMRRMRETAEGRVPKGRPPVRPEDVCVLFIEPGSKGAIVRELPLNDRGELVHPWPGGFFEEGLRELLA